MKAVLILLLRNRQNYFDIGLFYPLEEKLRDKRSGIYLKAVTPEQMKAIDRHAISVLGIPGVVLMENAGVRVFEAAVRMLKSMKDPRVLVLCGKGNNGGDGFVAARYLYNDGFTTEVFALASPDAITADAKVNLNILLNMGKTVKYVLGPEDLEELNSVIPRCSLIIDAIFGTGIRGAITGVSREIIDIVNGSGIPVLSVDVPSGIDGCSGAVCGDAIRAVRTVTMALPKTGLLLYPGAEYCGELEVAKIGIPRAAVESVDINMETVDRHNVIEMMPQRKPDTHKGSYGKVFIIGGSPGLTGAVVMAGQAAARSGSGLVTVGVPRSVYPIAATKLTEVMTLVLPDNPDGALCEKALGVVLKKAESSNVVAVGPGLLTGPGAKAVVEGLIEKSPVPLVIDADGINCLADNPLVLRKANTQVVLTPHPGEMARLMGVTPKDIQSDRLGWAKEAAADFDCCVVLKGARTITVLPDGRVYINLTGNPGMATGGSGDVLTGVIAALIAQGMSPADATRAGVCVHGWAGDMAAESLGMAGLLAGDIIANLPKVFREIEREQNACSSL